MIDDDLKHMVREEERVIDFAAIAKATTAKPSPEMQKILNGREPGFADFYEMLEANRLRIPLPATADSGASFRKSVKLEKNYILERGVESNEARHALTLASYYERHPDGGITERLRGLANKAKTLLSDEDGEVLERALAALDLYIVAACFEKAFCGIAA